MSFDILKMFTIIIGLSLTLVNTPRPLMNTFSSATKAGEFFNRSHKTILKYTKNGELFQNQWILSILEDTSACSKGTSDSD